MVSGWISFLMSFLPQGTAVVLLCAVCIGYLGIFIPLSERRKKREEQEWYRSRAQQYREDGGHAEQTEEQED